MLGRIIQYVSRHWEMGKLDAVGERVETLMEEVRALTTQVREMAGEFSVLRFKLNALADRRARITELERQVQSASRQ